jgi:hypothetical protein
MTTRDDLDHRAHARDRAREAWTRHRHRCRDCRIYAPAATCPEGRRVHDAYMKAIDDLVNTHKRSCR